MSMAMAMATALISMDLLLLLLMMMIYTATFHVAFVEADFSFSYAQADRTLPSNLVLLNNASFKSDGTVWLIPNPNEQQSEEMDRQTGWLLYNVPFPWERNSTSFSTSFRFQFFTPVQLESYPAPDGVGFAGDGMAFFISPHSTVPDSSLGMMLGLTSNDSYNVTDPSRRLFTIELDNYMNAELHDPNSNHAGIDINSLISTVTANLNSSSPHPSLDLYKNSSFMVWVDYSAADSSVEVRMANTNNMTSDTMLSRPPDPILNLTYDLSTVFLDSPLFVGLSATTGGRYQGCAIFSWHFSLTTPHKTNNKERILIPASIVGIVVAIVVLMAVIAYRKRCCHSPHGDQITELALIPNDVLVPAAMPRYTYKQLSKATQGFHDKARVGRGGFSTVYKGRLLVTQQPGKKSSMVYEEVAVKRLNREGLRKSDEFFKEINMINKLQHPRLVELKGWCYEKGEAMLVNQFMSNGSLADHLFSSRKEGTAGVLSSETRVEILKGVAEALNHLHGAGTVHRDVKAANVLLTSSFVAMLGDFGLLRLLKDDNYMTQTMTAAGTPGYTAPEVVFTRTPTNKVDVYSYGVLALEVACGRRVIDLNFDLTEERVLLNWVWSKHESGTLMEVLDPRMEMIDGEVSTTIWRCILHVALKCCHPIPEARPEMQEVLHALQHGVVVPLGPSRPPYPGAYMLHHPGFLDGYKSTTSLSSYSYHHYTSSQSLGSSNT